MGSAEVPAVAPEASTAAQRIRAPRPAPLAQRMLPLVDQARGRCHSCANQREVPMPFGTRYSCRAYGADMSAAERADVRGCPRWSPFRPHDNLTRDTNAAADPLFAATLDEEDRLFAHLRLHLQELGLDLKTLLVVAQPALCSTAEVSWVDQLDARFELMDPAPLDEILQELRALRYDSLCELLERAFSTTTRHEGR